MIDAHCHLNDPLYSNEELPRIISSSRDAGVNGFICNGSGIANSRRALEIANQFDGVYATAGIHPEDMNEFEELGHSVCEDEIIALAANGKTVAIGECGLDFTDATTDQEKRKQQELMSFNISLAQHTKLPMVVHCRNAFKEVYGLIKDANVSGQLHCFTGDYEWMRKFVDLGWYISFGGILTFKKSEELRDVCKQVPEERLLVETDAPYLAPEPLRSSRNQPANVMIIARLVAEIRHQKLERVGEFTTSNTKRLFRKIK